MIYLDNSATTKQFPEVTDLMVKCMNEDFGNPSALYQLGVDSEKIIKIARRDLAKAMSGGCSRDFSKSGRIVFTSGGTEADNMAILGTAKAMKRQGNRIITTEVEHPAVSECCKQLESQGFEVVRIGVDRHCRLNMEQLESAINDDTILLTIMHVNNEIGTVMPLREIGEILRKKKSKAVFHVDGVQSFGKMPMSESADMISISGHKIHGPKGSGALWVSDKVKAPALILGGGQEGGYRSGTENVAAIAGLGEAAAITPMTSAGPEWKSIGELREKLRLGLILEIGDIIVNSPDEIGAQGGMCCPSLLNVTFLGTRGEVLLHTLEQSGIYVSTGSACSSNKKGQSHVLKAMGLKEKEIEGTLRFSIGRFNTKEDIEIAVEKTAEAVKRFRKLGTFR